MFLIAGAGIFLLILIIFFKKRWDTENKSDKQKSNQLDNSNEPVQQGQSFQGHPPQMKEPPEDEIKKIMDELQKFVSYPLDKEKEIYGQLPSMTTKQMAQYADKIVQYKYQDTDFLETQLPEDVLDKLKQSFSDMQSEDMTGSENEDMKMVFLNPTVFGNSAFIHLNSPKPYSDRAKLAINFLKTQL